MNAIIRKEIRTFFGSIMGFLVIGVFMLITGLLLWIIENPYNILNGGFNDLAPFFQLAPIILLLLIPAVTMKSFADEKKAGTIEMLYTKPLGLNAIIWGKFFASLLLFIIAILPTFVAIFILNHYSLPNQNIDLAGTFGSFLGLIFLASAYISIGIFSSCVTENQIVSFLLAIILSALLYFGISQLGDLLSLTFIKNLSIQSHFESLQKGVLAFNDIIFFIGIIVLFLSLSHYYLNSKRK